MSGQTFRPAIDAVTVAFMLAWLAGCALSDPLPRTTSPNATPDPNTLTLYVSTAGNDAWTGRLAAPSPDGKDGVLFGNSSGLVFQAE